MSRVCVRNGVRNFKIAVPPEAEVRLVEGMYKGMKGGVLVGPGMSESFSVNIGLRQGSILSPLMFIMVMELVSRKVSFRGSISPAA